MSEAAVETGGGAVWPVLTKARELSKRHARKAGLAGVVALSIGAGAVGDEGVRAVKNYARDEAMLAQCEDTSFRAQRADAAALAEATMTKDAGTFAMREHAFIQAFEESCPGKLVPDNTLRPENPLKK